MKSQGISQRWIDAPATVTSGIQAKGCAHGFAPGHLQRWRREPSDLLCSVRVHQLRGSPKGYRQTDQKPESGEQPPRDCIRFHAQISLIRKKLTVDPVGEIVYFYNTIGTKQIGTTQICTTHFPLAGPRTSSPSEKASRKPFASCA